MMASKNYVELVKAVKAKFMGERPLYGYVELDTVKTDGFIPAKLGVIRLRVSLCDTSIDFSAEFTDGSIFGHSILIKEENKNETE